MTADTSHDSPNDVIAAAEGSPAPLLRSVVAVFGCALLGGLIGLGIGAALGAFVPSYYRAVFSNGHDPNFDPVTVGIGQGLTQGLVFGGVVGLVLTAMFYQRRSRTTSAAKTASRLESDGDETEPETSSAPRRSFRLLVFIAVLGPVLGAVPSCGVGCFIGYLKNDFDRGDRDVERINQIIAADPDRFSSLRINRGPADKFYLEGTVNTQDDVNLLHDELVREFGEERGEYILGMITVRGVTNSR